MVLTPEEQENIRKAIVDNVPEDFGITASLWTLGRMREYVQAEVNMISAISSQGSVRFMVYQDTMNQQRLIRFMERLICTSEQKVKFSRKSCVKADNQSSRKQEQIKGLPGQSPAQLNRAYPPEFRDEGRYARAA